MPAEKDDEEPEFVLPPLDPQMITDISLEAIETTEPQLQRWDEQDPDTEEPT